ncbi:SRA stem-loop-interacting RNA-binding protein, mitochondrial isoform X2 [Girardinichthys multiradiatus]|uniref:SRA stem-loop-interacting RNA-binding protein, mitochondrial isoform X2 n=1 Tax=Girardinichthys multiradiatus TaxID=208333 RepID=UPI001FAD40A2|nr:SRA stem-loop-interacting RNA-binding protein, mitochondrial isoform X2 [Girardinichthys multiradiatus]
MLHLERRTRVSMPNTTATQEKNSDSSVSNSSMAPIEEMKEYFGQFGPVKRCLLPFDRETGFHRGFCWVGFFTEEGLNNALQKDPHILEGAKLQVQRNRRPFAGQKSNQDGYLD